VKSKLSIWIKLVMTEAYDPCASFRSPKIQEHLFWECFKQFAINSTLASHNKTV